MEFRILGPLYADAGTGQGPVEICQPLLQSALAVLLLRANRTCPRSFLIEALWGTEPPAAPEAALRVCISRLRHALGDCAVRLGTIGPPGGRAPIYRQQRGYILTVRPGELDVDEFTDLAAQGQAELDVGNATGAAATFVQALSLWGDPPLPDLPPESDALANDVARLLNQRQAIEDALIDARLEAGEHDQLLGPLRAAIAADPGRERASEQLMRACHALGLTKEALDVYQSARRAALEQQGTEPGPALGVLYRRILGEEQTADSVAGIAMLTSSRSRLPGAQVPSPPADFTGRGDEVAAVVEHLSYGPGLPVSVISGPPGVGKTSVASAVAQQLGVRFPDGQLYAELGGLARPRDPQDALADMLETMGVTARSMPSAGPARAALYRSLLAGRRVLVYADDATSASQIRPLMPGVGGTALLVTSRGRLAALAGAQLMALAPLTVDDGLGMLRTAAGSERVDAELGAARAIAGLCGGLPLALRLAAATLAGRPGLSLRALADKLVGEDCLDVLQAEDLSVRDAIGVSFDALSPTAQLALRTAVADGQLLVPAAAFPDARIAAELTAVGLVTPTRAESPGEWYEVHPLVRRYALAPPTSNK